MRAVSYNICMWKEWRDVPLSSWQFQEKKPRKGKWLTAITSYLTCRSHNGRSWSRGGGVCWWRSFCISYILGKYKEPWKCHSIPFCYYKFPICSVFTDLMHHSQSILPMSPLWIQYSSSLAELPPMLVVPTCYKAHPEWAVRAYPLCHKSTGALHLEAAMWYQQVVSSSLTVVAPAKWGRRVWAVERQSRGGTVGIQLPSILQDG